MSIGNRLEYVLSLTGLGVSRALGPVRASNLFGAVARAIGPRLKVSRIADQNLRAAMPDLDQAGRSKIIRAVWDNLGRTLGELPHLARMEMTAAGPGFEIVGAQHMQNLPGPAIFVSAHFGNWEAFPPIAARSGILASSIYRTAANPLVDQLTTNLRRAGVRSSIPLFPKGNAGLRKAYAHLIGGGNLGMVVDQKLNEGVAADLFGMRAMTSSAAAVLALKLKCSVIPGHVERIGPARLRLTLECPLLHPATLDRPADVFALTQTINDRIEAWVRAMPGQWLWLHRRWTREVIHARLNPAIP